MKSLTLFFVATLGVTAQVPAVDLTLLATINGTSVVSATESKASGQARAVLDDDGKVTLDVAFAGLASGATGVELLMGKPTENGIVVSSLDVGGGKTGDSKTGLALTLTPEQEQAMREGMTYVTVRTIDYPGGAIRGQLLPQAPVLLGMPIVPGTESKSNNGDEPSTDR